MTIFEAYNDCKKQLEKAGIEDYVFESKQIIKHVTEMCGGKGGGKPDMAQGGGKDASKIDDALASVDELISGMIK